MNVDTPDPITKLDTYLQSMLPEISGRNTDNARVFALRLGLEGEKSYSLAEIEAATGSAPKRSANIILTLFKRLHQVEKRVGQGPLTMTAKVITDAIAGNDHSVVSLDEVIRQSDYLRDTVFVSNTEGLRLVLRQAYPHYLSNRGMLYAHKAGMEQKEVKKLLVKTGSSDSSSSRKSSAGTSVQESPSAEKSAEPSDEKSAEASAEPAGTSSNTSGDLEYIDVGAIDAALDDLEDPTPTKLSESILI